jgi:hypothetical protein
LTLALLRQSPSIEAAEREEREMARVEMVASSSAAAGAPGDVAQKYLARDVRAALRSASAGLVALMNRCAGGDDTFVARYAGRGWNDATERAMENDIVSRRPTRF